MKFIFAAIIMLLGSISSAQNSSRRAIVGIWCLETVLEDYTQVINFRNSGEIVSDRVSKQTGEVDLGLGVWSVDSNKLTIDFLNKPEVGAKTYQFEISDNTLSINLKNGDPIRVFGRCDLLIN